MLRTVFHFLVFLIFFNSLFSQKQFVNGEVTDTDGLPLEGVSIFWQSGKIFTWSDPHGSFNIPFSTINDTLYFEHLGFHPEKIAGNSTTDPFLVLEMREYPLSLPPFEVVAKSAEKLGLLPGRIEFLQMSTLPHTQTGDVTGTLKYLPDIQIIGNGAGGGVKSIKMNGFGSNHVAFQLEGVSINSPQNGGIDLSLVNSNNLENILIKYGGNAVDAGSSAMGGVVNFSILPEQYRNSSKAIISTGSFANYQLSAAQTLAFGEYGGLRVGFNYRIGQDDYTYSEFDKEKKVNNAEFERRSFYVGGKYQAGPKTFYKILATLYDGHTGIPSANPYETSDQANLGGFLQGTFYTGISSASSLKISSSFTRENLKYNNYNINIHDDYMNDHVAAILEYQNSANSSRWRFFSRLEANYFRLKSTVISFHDESDIRFSAAGRYGFFVKKKFSAVLSGGVSLAWIEYDRNYRSDYRLGLKGIWQYFNLFTSLHTGYKIPTFNDRYWPKGGSQS